MRILLAAPDRDLLMTYKRLFELDSYTVTAVFDVPQAAVHIGEQRFDLAIVDRSLPRGGSKEILKRLNEKEIPSVLLIEHKITPNDLLEYSAASSYMSYPFFPYELKERAAEVLEKAGSKETLSVGESEINVSKFRSSDGTRFTNEEINILRAIKNGDKFDVRHISSYINALNNKFERMKKKTRVKYVLNEGYRLVNENE